MQTKSKSWFFDVTLANGQIVRDVRVEAIDEDSAMDALYACDALPAIEITATHLQHCHNGKTRRS
jgi:hypothetical protein